MKYVALGLTAALAVLGLVACQEKSETTVAQATEAPPASTEAAAPAAPIGTNPAPAVGQSADVTLQSHDPKVSGTVHFTNEANGVHVVADVKGAKPGEHGFHLHEKGDCSSPDYKSAGGHFNPASAPHACDPTNPRHAGDFGNITIDKDGNGHLDFTTTALSFDGANSLVGKAVIFHAKQDDCKTQPTGDAGDRVACGVVNAAGGAAASSSSAMGTEAMGTEKH
jgi:superoxide dismutase, Cu-Zn family